MFDRLIQNAAVILERLHQHNHDSVYPSFWL